MKVAWIGLGKLGLPCAEVMARAGNTVQGYDPADVKSDLIDLKDDIPTAIAGTKFIFVAVPTPHDERYDGSAPSSHLPTRDFDYSIVESVLGEINFYAKTGQKVVLVSTVLPGTIRNRLQFLMTRIELIYNPYFIAMGSVKWDMENPEMVTWGTETGDEPKELLKFYKKFLPYGTKYHGGTWEEAECIKIFYNTWISTKITLANTIQDVAQRLGNTNVDVITDALKDSTMRIVSKQYMTSGAGDAGACHPRDNIALSHLANKLDLKYDWFGSIMEMRERQAELLADYLIKQSKHFGLKDIVIYGKAYKPGVAYTDGSYSLLVGHYLARSYREPKYVDPLTGDNIQLTKPAIILLAHDRAVTYEYSQHESKKQELYSPIPKGSVVVDLWRSSGLEDGEFRLLKYGDTGV